MDEELILECIEEMNNAHANFEKSLATLRRTFHGTVSDETSAGSRK